MSRRTNQRRDRDAELHEPGELSGQLGAESGGQSGDTQGLTPNPEADDESVEELAEEDQAFEAEAVEGVEEAGDEPEQPVRSHQDRRPLRDDELPPDPDWK